MFDFYDLVMALFTSVMKNARSKSMSQNETNQHSGSENRLEMDFRSLSFPSDHLSVARFRQIFPQLIDVSGLIADGYCQNALFRPVGMGEPLYLEQLNQMICAERTIACGAFYRQFLLQYPELLEQEDYESIQNSKDRLEQHYLRFKLADSPETARLLIAQIEEDSVQEAIHLQSKQR